MARRIVEDKLHKVIIVLAGAAAVWPAAPARAQGVTMCHATGNPNMPYVELTLSGAALDAHAEHPDDLVPAPPGGCPPTTVPPDPDETPAPPAATTPAPYAVPTVTPTPLAATPAPAPVATRPPAPLLVSPRRRSAPPLRAAPPVTPAVPRALPAPALPLTGSSPGLIALFGLGFLACGSGGWLLLRGATKPGI